MTRPARIEIDLHAVRANLARVRACAPNQKIMAVIKADAYGHGLIRMAQALTQDDEGANVLGPDMLGVDALGVACCEEATALRDAGIGQRVVLLEGPFGAQDLSAAAYLNLDIVIHDAAQLALLEAMGQLKRRITVWLKIDTGMHRLGFSPFDAVDAYARLKRCPVVAPVIHLMTHLTNGGQRGTDSVDAQLTCFNQTVAELPGPRSVANSSGVLGWPETHGDWVRPGLMLYGISPFDAGTARDEGLTPVMTVYSEIIAVKRVAAGETVGYGGVWRARQELTVGVVAFGYGDGYPRAAGGKSSVLVNGYPAPVIGAPSMDMLNVDLSTVPAAKIGDTVILWGADLPVETVARHAGTIAYEIVCGVRQRARVIAHNR